MASFNNTRQHERRAYVDTIDYSVSIYEFSGLKRLNLKCQTVDISEGGIGILADLALESGHVVIVKYERDIKTGIVRWTRKQDSAYRVGIRFV